MTKYLDEQGLNTLWAKTKKTIKTNIDNIQIPEQITTATIDVDNNVGTPSATASVVGNTIAFDFKNLKGETGPKGAAGETGPAGSQGEQGPKGDAFKYSDFTPDQLASLKGPQGEKGDTGLTGPVGPKGEAFTYNDFTEEQLESLKGPKGDIGLTGPAGTDGAPAGFGEIVATVDNSTGTPNVTVTTSGTNEAKNFTFAFTGLKGEKGDAGSGGGSSSNFEVVPTLPESPDPNKIYFVVGE